MFSRNSSNSEHLTDDLLVQYLDGELSGKRAAKAKEHLEICWRCRGRAKEFEKGVLSFLQHRKVIVRELGDPPGGFQGFHARMAQQREELLALKKTTRALDAGRIGKLLAHWGVAMRNSLLPRVTLATATFVVAAWMLFPTLPHVLAKEALKRAAQSEERMLHSYNSPVVHQQITVHTHGKQARWEIWRAPQGKKVRTTWNDGEVSQEIKGIYRDNNLDAEQPLSASGFSTWRESLAEKQDRITVDTRQHLVQISTEAMQSGTGQIQQVIFTLRQDDWHPVNETIYVHGADGLPTEYRLEETSYTVLPLDLVPTAVFVSSNAGAAEPATTSSAASGSINAVLEPTEARLLDSEVKLTKALHDVGADVREAPAIYRRDGEIAFSAWTEGQERKQQLLAATTKLPYIVSDIRDASSVRASKTAVGSALPALRSSYPTEPPLAKALWDYYGSAEAANRNLSEISDDEQAALAEASALSRLAKEYPETRWQQLPAQSQAILNQIAADHLAAIHRHSAAYLQIVSPLLDAMLTKENVNPEVVDQANRCASWRTAAPLLAEDLPRTQISLQRLFLEGHVETPVQDMSSSTLLTESARLRSRIRAELGQLCTP